MGRDTPLCVILCLLLAGCEVNAGNEQIGRVSIFKNGCKGWVGKDTTMNQETTKDGLKCVIEYRRPR